MKTQQVPRSRLLTEYLYSKASLKKIPLSGTFELSPVCNFACKMCYVRKTNKEVQESPRKILTLEDWRRIAREAFDAGTLDLLLTGGEPLLWPDFWPLYEELADMGFRISINTNGSLIDEDAITRFRKRPPQKISITLYGASDETYQRLCGAKGVFTKVDRAIRGLLDAGISVKINCSLTPENAEDLDWIVDYAKARDTVLAVTTYMFPPVRRDPAAIGRNERFTPEESAKYLLRYIRRYNGDEKYRVHLRNILDGYVDPPGLETDCVDTMDGKVRCRAGKASFWITWDGWMTPCGMMSVPKSDLIGRPFPDAWKELTTATDQLRLSSICDSCANREICHPCAAISLAETGESTGIPSYMCRATQEHCRIARETLQSEIERNLPYPSEPNL